MVFTYSRAILAAPLILGLGAVNACTCPSVVEPSPNKFTFVVGETLTSTFGSLEGQCSTPLTDECVEPAVCECVNSDFLVPTPDFEVDDETGAWFFVVNDDVVCSTLVVPTCAVSFF